jgi:hypothetical protein
MEYRPNQFEQQKNDTTANQSREDRDKQARNASREKKNNTSSCSSEERAETRHWEPAGPIGYAHSPTRTREQERSHRKRSDPTAKSRENLNHDIASKKNLSIEIKKVYNRSTDVTILLPHFLLE